ncbi:MAG: histidine kinase [Verrucomicrobia bacterium]|nr:histidine kinase [Verrucomicrobiota bacterium]
MSPSPGNQLSSAGRPFHSWKLLLIGFTAVALFYTGVSYVVVVVVLRSQFHFTPTLLFNAAQFYFWAALAPVVIRIARRLSITRQRWGAPLLLHVLLCLACALLVSVPIVLLFSPLGMPERDRIFPTVRTAFAGMGEPFALGAVIYALLVIAAYASEYYVRYRQEELRAHQLQSELADAKLRALKMQLQPHFLFNTLHSISELVDEDPAAATRMLARLGDFLRLTLDSPDIAMIPLEHELKFIQSYLEIEKVRFADRLEVAIDAEEAVLDAQVPIFILQPLVENAMRHGVATRLGKSIVAVSACRRAAHLELTVRDEGHRTSVLKPNGKMGVGLSNTKERLRHAYGEDHRFTFSHDNGRTEVTLRIPFISSRLSSVTSSKEA